MRNWFRRRSSSRQTGSRDKGRGGAEEKADLAHLREFATTRAGVEGFVEPPTVVTQTTLVLVAVDGEWTRRRVPDAKAAHDFANKLSIPSYDAAVVGYPRRMREWTRKRAAEEKRRQREALEPE